MGIIVKQIKAWTVDGETVTIEDFKHLKDQLVALKFKAETYGVYELASFDEIIGNVEGIIHGEYEPGEEYPG